MGNIDRLFKANESSAYEFVRAFMKEYSALPTEDTITVHTGEKLVKHKEVAKYYLDLMEARHIEIELKKGMQKASEFLLPDSKDPAEALQQLTEMTMKLMATKHAKQIVDFREAYDLVLQDYADKFNAGDNYGLKFGWPTLDGMTGGCVPGDVISFVGRPAAGKTWMMLKAAFHGWKMAGTNHDPTMSQSRLFVSMEMSVLSIQQRLAAMQSKVSMSKLDHAKLGTAFLKQLKKGMLEVKGFGAPFYVVDGNLTSTVEDVYMMASQLKPAAVFIDGAYLLQNPNERDIYKRVATNCNAIKSSIAKLAPTVASWQFAKTAAKKNKKAGEEVTMEDIAYSDGIAQNSSLVLGLFEEDSVETLKQRAVKVLKGRKGETGGFTTRWDFQNMNFDEMVPPFIEDLKFL
jgi:replicative DNA helicase